MNKIDRIILCLNKDNSMMGDLEVIFKYSQHKGTKVELGTADGITTILISRNGGKTFTIDRNNDETTRKYLLNHFNINAIQGDTVEAADLFLDHSIDFIFIDGGHSFEQVAADYKAWWPKMKVDSVLLFHDMDIIHEGVLDFYNRIIKQDIEDGSIEEIPQDTTFETIIKVFTKIR